MEDEVEDKAAEKSTDPIGKPRVWSLVAKILGVLVILVGHILKWVNIIPNATSSEIVACGFAIMGMFGTVDFNMMLDKFAGK